MKLGCNAQNDWNRIRTYSDIKMHLFIEEGMGGGIPYNAKRYSKTNNKHMTHYCSSEESKFIIYLDISNLYGWAMSQYLPYGRFKWLYQKDCL